jgi:dTDP-4-dehydrorhamnose reductase
MRIAITGAGGQLGQAMVRRLSTQHTVSPLTHTELDIARSPDVFQVMAAIRPQVIVNCAAYNAVDRAEGDVLAALDGNAFGVQALACAAAREDALLVHFSTDFVFDGEARSPYTEDAAVAPLSVYGQSKLLGEWLSRAAPRRYVLRVESLFGGPLPRSSIDKIADAIRAGHEARVFEDRVVSPSFVEDVVTATATLIHGGVEPGIYHCVNSGSATWYDVAREIASVLGVEARLQPVRLADVPMRARRPRYCALSNAKLAAAGIAMPSWEDAVRRHLTAGTARRM